MKKLILAASLVLCLAFSAGAKKMIIINIDKGAIPDSIAGCTASLDDNEKFCGKKGGMSLKVECAADEGCFIAECPPKKAVWDGFDVIKYNIYNPQKGPISINMTIKSKQFGNDYNKRIDYTCMAKPGMNEIEFDITGTCANDGSIYDWKGPIGIWTIAPGLKKGEAIYLSNFRVETAEDDSKDSKKSDTKDKK